MNNIKKNSFLLTIFSLISITFILSANVANAAELKIGEIPKEVKLDGDLGGRVDGNPFSTAELKGKVYTVMYVDPDEKDINPHVEAALKAEDFPKDKYGSVAIINMAATWKPNVFIESALKEKQQKYPNTTYVRDIKKTFVKEWELADDNYDILTFNKEGKLLFAKNGKFSDEDVSKLIATIKEALK
ncbi:MAG: transcriptional regulator [Oligoflexia bacterium]|nr:transcriptional regulator [Oligoflexia bacterium]